MNQTLVDSMWTYLKAGLAMDIDALDRIYDPEFEYVRVDQAGQTITLTKDQFMAPSGRCASRDSGSVSPSTT
ncbi:hypothetical protein [Spongiactinospora sp. TRM90649]|uniref:hypothetical protein n=1 Tax=Spongiactinospora sp. TRM90649 TaxID=3031114 RepID=UPI0023F9F958|nr:hypothetical protein [Spongiactinospora sp. TRM90649]MDF5751173.1 hypothetical protein [Spongiactinospora sp. TRM90649]